MWQKPWSSGAGTKVDGSSPWVRLGSQCRTLQHPCSCARLRLSPLTGQKACPVLIFPVLVTESVCGSWTWGGAGQRSKSPSGHPSFLHPRIQSIVVSFATWILILSDPRLPVSTSAVSPVLWPSLPSPFRVFPGLSQGPPACSAPTALALSTPPPHCSLSEGLTAQPLHSLSAVLLGK